MTIDSSSAALHPRSGARFVFVREDDASNARYSAQIYLADGRTISGTLAWRDSRTVWSDDVVEADSENDDVVWARGQAVKLARVLKSSGQARLTRWRGK